MVLVVGMIYNFSMLRELFEKINSTRITLAQWMMAFFGVMFVRIFLENFSSIPATGNWTSDASTIVHYYLYYVAVTVSLLLFLGLFIDRAKLERVSLFALAGNVVAPLLDLFISHGQGFLMHYIFADGSGLFTSFFLFFTPATIPGITPGMKIEFCFGLLAFFLYVAYSTRSAVKGALAALGSYAIMFFWGSLPSFWKLIHDLFSSQGSALSVSQFFGTGATESVIARNFFHPTVQVSYLRSLEVFFNVAISEIYYILIFVLVAIYFFTRNRRAFFAILENSRQFRAAHYYLLILIGLLLGSKIAPAWISWNWFDAVSLAVLFLAFFCARAFAGGVNDIEDLEADRVSNSKRPLPSGRLAPDDIKNANLFFLVWAILGGFLVGQYVLFTIIAALFISYIYSVPPLRLKNYPFIATFLISLASCAAFAAGFYFTSPDKTTKALPIVYLVLIIVGLTLGENVKDIKDIEGDKRSGAYTLPVIFGEEMGKRIIGILAAVAFMSVPVILGSVELFIPSLLAGSAAYFLIDRKKYTEWPIFLVGSLYAAIVIPLFLFIS